MSVSWSGCTGVAYLHWPVTTTTKLPNLCPIPSSEHLTRVSLHNSTNLQSNGNLFVFPHGQFPPLPLIPVHRRHGKEEEKTGQTVKAQGMSSEVLFPYTIDILLINLGLKKTWQSIVLFYQNTMFNDKQYVVYNCNAEGWKTHHISAALLACAELPLSCLVRAGSPEVLSVPVSAGV